MSSWLLVRWMGSWLFGRILMVDSIETCFQDFLEIQAHVLVLTNLSPYHLLPMVLDSTSSRKVSTQVKARSSLQLLTNSLLSTRY